MAHNLIICLAPIVALVLITLQRQSSVAANIVAITDSELAAILEQENLANQAYLDELGQLDADSEPPEDFDPEYMTGAQQQNSSLFLLEGDMELGEEIVASDDLEGDEPASFFFDAVRDRKRIWPNAVVPYVFDRRLDAIQRGLMFNAFKAFHDNTCIRFKARQAETNYLFIRKVHLGCYSKIGYLGQAKQRVSFHAKCFTKFGTVLHELMHTLGFYHEQSRNDRDEYVRVITANIQYNQQHNFDKVSLAEIDHLGQPYDYYSLLHYKANAFARDSTKSTIVPKKKVTIGQRIYFSELDVKKLNILYSCASKPQCAKGETACPAPHAKRCARPCDSVPQCPDSSDESGCPPKVCKAHQWSCAGKCIPESWLCDGHADCIGGADELPANCKARRCNPKTEFDCGKCIPRYRICDKRADCLGGQDETPEQCAAVRQPLAPARRPAPVVTTPRAPAPHRPPPYPAVKPTRKPQQPIWPPPVETTTRRYRPKVTCASYLIPCADHTHCFARVQRCDGKRHCIDNTDESNCPPARPAPPSYGPPPTSDRRPTPSYRPSQPHWPRPDTSRYPSERPSYYRERPTNSPERPTYGRYPSRTRYPPEETSYRYGERRPSESRYRPSSGGSQYPYDYRRQPVSRYRPRESFGRPVGGLFNRRYQDGYGFDTVEGGGTSTPRQCFVDIDAFNAIEELRVTEDTFSDLVAHIKTPCTTVALGMATLVADDLADMADDADVLDLGGDSVEPIVLALNEEENIDGFVVVVGGGLSELAMAEIGADTEKAERFAALLRSNLRRLGAAGVVLQWLEPGAEHRPALNTLLKSIAVEFQGEVDNDNTPKSSLSTPNVEESDDTLLEESDFLDDNLAEDEFLAESDRSGLAFDPIEAPEEAPAEEEVKPRLIIGMNVLAELQAGQDKVAILDNVDYINVIPNPKEVFAADTTFYGNEMLNDDDSIDTRNTWLASDNTTLARINIGVRLAPLTWTVATVTTLVGTETVGPGHPGRWSGSAGSLAYGELCTATQHERFADVPLAYRLTAAFNSSSNYSYAYSLTERQWVSFESARSLQARLGSFDERGFGGLYVVDAAMDDWKNVCEEGRFPLMVAIGEAVTNLEAASSETAAAVVESSSKEIPSATFADDIAEDTDLLEGFHYDY